MTIEELIASLTTDAHNSILPKADECAADEARMAEPANVWLTALACPGRHSLAHEGLPRSVGPAYGASTHLPAAANRPPPHAMALEVAMQPKASAAPAEDELCGECGRWPR